MFLFSRTKLDQQMSDASAAPSPSASTDAIVDDQITDEIVRHLDILGLSLGASWDQIRQAHSRLVSDLTPGPNANHRNVELAKQLLGEVNRAYDALLARSSSVA